MNANITKRLGAYGLAAGILIACSQACAQTVIIPQEFEYADYPNCESGTVALWHMDETSGDVVADTSGNDNGGSRSHFSNGWSTATPRDDLGSAILNGDTGSLYFAGDNDFIEVQSSDSLKVFTDQLTIEAWIRPTGTGNTDRTIVRKMKQTGDAGGFLLRLSPHSGQHYIQFAVKVAGHGYFNLMDLDTPVPWDSWSHVAGTYNGNSAKIFLNGELIMMEALSGNLINSDTDLVLGRLADDYADEYFHGHIDEVRISSVARDFVPVPLDPDLDGDGDIDADDIDALCDNLGDAAYDLDEDGDSDEDDLIYMVENLVEWSRSGGPSGVGTGRGDHNLDGWVNATDLANLVPYFGNSGVGWAGCNFNCDDLVNATDLAILAANFGFDASAAPVPEPATMGLLSLGGLALLKRRK